MPGVLRCIFKKISLSAPLRIKSVTFCLAENGNAHHTLKYNTMKRNKNPALVVRRGQPFSLCITLNRSINHETDEISLKFTYMESNKTNVEDYVTVKVPLLKEKNESVDNKWYAVIAEESENVIMINVNTPSDSIIGYWKLDFNTKHLDVESSVFTHSKAGFYLLFNPWCVHDTVYIEDENCRKEYVLNDIDLIARGTYNSPEDTVWRYAHFEEDILQCSLSILDDIGKMSTEAKNDPIKVSRVISAAVNANDDNGVMMGNWSDKIIDGTHPSKWVGSMEILQNYHKSKKSVKYGQCWVFAGITGTICRAIGIPCRTVTAYSCAHDTHNSLTIDYFLDEENNMINRLNTDSIWNYHVWNEVWMTRPDLGPMYSGWQVIDSTPQEKSNNIYRCGPTPVAAVKLGEINQTLDCGFIFSEVNADVLFWKYNGAKQPPKLISKDTNAVGKRISTKAVGEFKTKDITDNYKYPEKSSNERHSLQKALRLSNNRISQYYLNADINDLQFDLVLKDNIIVGEPFTVTVHAVNHSQDKAHQIEGNLSVHSITYTGSIASDVKSSKFKKTLEPLQTDELTLHVTFEEYYNKIVDQGTFNIKCYGKILESDYEYFAQDDFRICKPEIEIIAKNKPILGEKLQISMSLKNPLPVAIAEPEFIVEGCILKKQLKIKLNKNIAVNECASACINVKLKEEGQHTIAVKFVSSNLDNISGYFDFTVGDK